MIAHLTPRTRLLLTLLASPTFILATQSGSPTGTGAGLRGDYYSNTGLTGSVALSRTDPAIDFQWGQASPVPSMQVNRFSVRWSGQVEAPVTGTYTFSTKSDDGVRLWIDGKLLINHWSDHSAAYDQCVPLTLTAGKHNIQLAYYEDLGNSVIKLLWRYPNQAEQIIPKSRLYPVAIPLQAAPAVVSRVWLSDLDWFSVTNGWGPQELDRSNGEKGSHDGKAITIGGRRYEHGIGVHSQSEIRYALDDRYDMFKAVIGVDDEVGDKGSVIFEVCLDGRRAYQSGIFKGNMPGLAIEVPVENVREMRLVVTNAGDGIGSDHADWADARFEGVEKVKYLSDMNWVSATNGSGPVERDRANGSSASQDGARIKPRGVTYRKGLGTRAVSEIKYNLDKKYELFSAILGIDDSANGGGSVIFEVWTGTTRLYRSDTLTGKDAVKHMAVSVMNLETLTLKVLDAGNGNAGDLADWANAKLLPIGSDSTPPPTSGMPAVPAGLAATAGNAQIQLAWQASSVATSYNLYRGATANGQSATAIASNITGTSYTNAGLTNGTPYFYKVRAVNSAGMSGMSNEASATPSAGPAPVLPPQTAPSGFTATPGNGQVTLNWNAVPGATSYMLMRGTTGTNVTTTSFTDTGLTNGATYTYRIAARNAAGTGPSSSPVSVTLLGAPAAPASLTATPGTSQITLTWPAIPGATSYRVYRGTASNGQAAVAIASNLTSPTYVNTGLASGTTYFYKVTAVNSVGESPRSPEASASTMSIPVAPGGLSATPGNGLVTLSWMPVSGATTYNVYRGTAANAQAATPIVTGLTSPAFANTGLTNGTAYFYKVTAVNTAGQSPRSAEASATPNAPAPGVDPATLSAFRLLRQATWGPKPGDVDRVRQIGRAAFLDQEFAAPVSVYPDTLYSEPVEVTQEHFMRLALTGSDQLRQRVAWALHQIWVVSAVEVNNARGIVNYKRILLNGAFGNYRDLMRDMTLNPAMGRYLNMLNNRSQQVTGALPNENYARELKQLFTLGTSVLLPTGAPALDGQGRSTPTYTEDDVKELARILTGWTCGDGNPATVPTRLASENYTVPMEPVAAYHDTGAKTFLGVAFPAGQTARQDLDQALDVIFNHANVGPFICRQLILHLVTSNPSPAYISDIAAVFANNGSGVRGDLAAVVRAILDHPEAGLGTPTSGKLMEPALFVISQARALNAQVVDTPFMSNLAEEMGQKVFYPPSVFSYFSPGYRIRATNLVGPEFQILTTVTTLSRTNYAGRLISNGFGADVTIDFTPFTSRAADASALVDYCSLLLMGGQISSEQRAEIISAVSVTPASNTTERARTALYLILAAAQYQVYR